MISKVVCFPLSEPWNHHSTHRLTPLLSTPRCALTKQSLRFLSTLAVKSDDPSAAVKLIGKFVAGSPKAIALNALTHLLSPETTHPYLTAHSLTLYMEIKEAPWFQFNPKLVASLAALLDKHGNRGESGALISEAAVKLNGRQREIASFYCDLVESNAKQGSVHGFETACLGLNEILRSSLSSYVKRRAFEALIGGLCTMDRPSEAERLMREMRVENLKPTVFEFRSVIFGYGRLGLWDEMLKIVDELESEGLLIDTICSNMVLSSYGARGEVTKMVTWLQRMKSRGVAFSIRTYNSVLNQCPSIVAMLDDLDGIPLSMGELRGSLIGDEAMVVEELVGSGVLEGVAAWDPREAKLDLHGMHLATAYLVMLEWMDEMRGRLEGVVPVEVVVVCGSGKHSSVRGISPVKLMLKKMMVRTGSPMRVDRKNTGCFIAKGKTVKDWLCASNGL